MLGCHPGSQFPSGFSVDLCVAPGLPPSLSQTPVFRGLFPTCEVGLGSAGVGGRCDQLCPRPPQASPVPLPALLPHGGRPRGGEGRELGGRRPQLPARNLPGVRAATPVLGCSGDLASEEGHVPRGGSPAEPPRELPPGSGQPRAPPLQAVPPALFPVPGAGGWVCGGVSGPGTKRLRTSGPLGTRPHPGPTGVATRSLPPRPHPRLGCAASGHGGCPGVPLRLSDGVLPHHTLQTPRQVGRLGAVLSSHL